MGFGDYVTVEVVSEEAGIAPGTRFYTKAFCHISQEFTITAEGEFVEQLCRYEHDPNSPNGFPLRRIPTGHRTISYHGDIFLWGNRNISSPALRMAGWNGFGRRMTIPRRTAGSSLDRESDR